MKARKVSVLRERGGRRVCGAEPQVSERINSIERKADTMKTYLLRTPNTVEPQTRGREFAPCVFAPQQKIARLGAGGKIEEDLHRLHVRKLNGFERGKVLAPRHS